jgi:hypothetical protein
MRGDPWHREPPLRAGTPDEAAELSSALHDCWIDLEGITPERPEEHKGRIVSYRLPLALDEAERRLLPDSEWELVIRNPRSLKIDDGALIAIYTLLEIDASPERVTLKCAEDLTIEIGVGSLDVAVEARAPQASGSL